MAISQTKYINITSAAGGGSIVAQRDLMGRVFTTNELVPVGEIIEFSGGLVSAKESIGNYFGITSDEYAFAEKYFQVNKKGTAPQKLGFARYVDTACGAYLYGKKGVKLSDLQAVTAGTFGITVNGVEKTYSALNFSSATSLADVATALTTAMTSDGLVATYETNGRFKIATEDTGSEQELSLATGTVAEILGMANGVLSVGGDAETPLECVVKSTGLSNNFFSFCFLDMISNSDIAALAAWTHGQNVNYMFSVAVNETNAETIKGMVENYDGVALTLDIYGEHGEFMPMSRIASIDYTRANAAISMFYQQFVGVDPSVNDTDVAAAYDALKVNYYGETAKGGISFPFYQNGVLQGSISDMGVYANEAWLKDSFVTDILNLRLAVDTLPANNVGVGMILGSLMETVNLSLYNGVTMPGKTLDNTQKSYITQITGNSDAWMAVQGNGYYLDANVEKYTENDVEKYKVSFLYVYSKGDSINYVDGRDILI
ncbi:MAG: DUF3383 domain-containing protein [Neisseriaceae bacterium]|nr:DUF3383 domain-containing protein [Neisseriaceae bacterium]